MYKRQNRNFRRKRFDGEATYRHGPTGLSINAFNEDRENQDATSTENTYGAGALWTWRFAPRTASFLGTGWEHDDLGEDELGQAQQNDYWVSVIGPVSYTHLDVYKRQTYRSTPHKIM